MDGFRERFRRLGPVLVLGAIEQASGLGTRPLVSLYAHQLNVPTGLIGALAALYAVAPMLLTLVTGRFVAARGSRTAAGLGSLLLVVSFGMVAWTGGVPALAVAQALSGAGFVLAMVACQTAVADAGERGEHDHNFAILTTVFSVSQLLGPPISGLLSDALGYRGAFAIFAGASAIGLAYAFHPRWPAPAASAEALESRTSRAEAALLLRSRPLVRTLLSGASVMFAQESLFTFFPLKARALGLSDSLIGLILGVRAVSYFAIRPFMGAMVARFGRLRVLFHSMAWGGVATLMMGVGRQSLVLLGISAAGGIALGLAQPLTMALVAEITPPHQRGLALSLRMAGNRLGQTLSALLLGLLAGPLGVAAPLWCSGILLSLMARAITEKRGTARTEHVG